MTKEEEIARMNEALVAEEFFPGFLGNPVAFSMKWGIPLSSRYLKDLERRKPTPKKSPASRKRRKSSSS